MTLLIFIGRSHPYNIFHASIAFSLVSTYWLALLHRRASPARPDASARAPAAAGGRFRRRARRAGLSR